MNVYRDEYTKEISFPLGGVGTGCIGLAGNGALVDFEIKNRPNKQTYNGFSGITVKAEDDTRVLDVRSLQGDCYRSHQGDTNGKKFSAFGFGLNRNSMAGLPHFQGHTFTGEYPFARIDFAHERFPGMVTLNAFNPFIPLNDKDSSLPAAFFEVEFENTSNTAINYTAAISLTNPIAGGNVHTFYKQEGHSYIALDNNLEKSLPEYGSLCIATDGQSSSHQSYWYRGTWFDCLEIFWKDFSAYGPIKDRTYGSSDKSYTSDYSDGDTATLTAAVKLEPGEVGKLRVQVSMMGDRIFKKIVSRIFIACQGTGGDFRRKYYPTLIRLQMI